MLYPATINVDFYIQADSTEEADQKLKNIIEKQAFQHNSFEFPEIEQPEYNNGCILDATDKERTTGYDRDEVLLDIAINLDFVNLKIKYDFDSRELTQAIASWADEFLTIHQNTDWYETDYFLTIDAFSEQKLKNFTSKLKY